MRTYSPTISAKRCQATTLCHSVLSCHAPFLSLNRSLVARLSLATNERFKDKNDQWQDRTEWHSIVAWQRLAEIVGEYVRKGSKLYVEGKLQTSTWEDKQSGEKKYRTEIVAREILLLSSGENGQEDRQTTAGEESTPDSVSAPVDDDIPF